MDTVTFTFFLSKASFSSSVTSTSSSNSSKKSSLVFLLPIFLNALLINFFSTFPVFDSTDTLTHHVVSILLLLFDMDLPQWPSMKLYIILEVFRIEIEQIIFSRFWNGTEKISGIKHFFFMEVNKKISRSGRFYQVGQKRGNKQYFSFDLIRSDFRCTEILINY